MPTIVREYIGGRWTYDIAEEPLPSAFRAPYWLQTGYSIRYASGRVVCLFVETLSQMEAPCGERLNR